MSTIELSESQTKLIQETAEKNGITNPIIVAEPGTINGDNFLGVIYKVKAKADHGDKVMHFILKTSEKPEHFRKEARLDKIFEREVYLYDTAISSLQEFQEKFNLTQPFTGVAQYYGSLLEDDSESILMENLKEHGYCLWDRYEPMDDAHINAVFAEYARLHAASMAFRQKEPEKFEEVTKCLEKSVYEESFEADEKYKKVLGTFLAAGAEAVKGNERAIKAHERVAATMAELGEHGKNVKKDHLVIIHGDSWCNNMLFKYENESKSPTKVCFIDWQQSKLGSPLLDLSYFFCCAATEENLSNLNKYLKTYHDTLSQYLQECDLNPEEIYSFQEFLEDWKKFCKHGIFLSFVMIKVVLSESNEAPDVTQSNKDVNFLDALTDFSMSREAEYRKRVCDLLVFMDGSGYL